jgi:rhodanese-related sulfurtransferase
VAAIDTVLTACRSRIRPRLNAAELDGAIADGALVVDTRPADLRRRDGVIPGTVAVERNVLEWRLDPSSPHRLAEMDGPTRQVIVVCDEGYASSLAAAALLDLGLSNVTDLNGGYQAWRLYQRTQQNAR